MSKERLEEIEVRLKYGLGCLKNLRRKILNSNDESLKDQIKLLENDIKFLFEQAKRVQELEEIAETDGSAFHTLEKLFIESEQQNKRYREALEFYADRNNYLPEHLDPETDEKWSKIDYDEGFNARKTLEKECTNGRYCQTNFR